VLTGFARGLKSLTKSRAGSGLGLSSLLLLVGAGAVHDATALNETRTLSFHHTHSGEDLTVTFKRNGRYDEAALKQLNNHLRDWRNQDSTTMDRRLFDILWEVYRDVDGKQPIHIISAYRSPATNAMLRRRSSGVARHSQHMLGHAMDFFIPGVPLEQIRFAGLRLQRGGVGFYPTSGSPFVHLDTGSIRHWPRMSHDQLARVFPNGRTVHVPSDGQPLSGYELAMADIEKRGDDASSSNKPSLFTSLFKGKSAEDEDEGAPVQAVPSRPNPASVMANAAAPAEVPSVTVAAAGLVPMPRAKPAAAGRIQLASAAEVTLPAAASASAQFTPPRPPLPVGPSASDARPPQTPADIINARGFWDDMPAPKQATPAQVAAITARQALAAADTTGSIDSSFQALSYASASDPTPIDRTQVVAAGAPVPRSVRSASVVRNPMAVNAVTTVVAKGLRAPGVATATRLTAAANRDNEVWMRAMVLTPSASAMHATVMGEPDLTMLRAHFVKPVSVVAMSFGNDPQLGISTDGFSGAAVTRLATLSFMTRIASLR
jgi:uncharacterized protein YcbK (DUF882 family)